MWRDILGHGRVGVPVYIRSQDRGGTAYFDCLEFFAHKFLYILD